MNDLKYSMREWDKYDTGERKCVICKSWPSKIYVIAYSFPNSENMHSTLFKSGYNCCSEACFNMFILSRDKDSTVWI